MSKSCKHGNDIQFGWGNRNRQPGEGGAHQSFFFSGKMPIIWVKTNKNSNKLIKELLRIKLSGISTLVSLDTRIVNI